ncbi:MAG: large-conductance mechanosensitive channel protein MscL [Bacteroidota bacterium]|nr:large-conductance mechanosensitive channel protein MscL [Bacteroidota bacterium]
MAFLKEFRNFAIRGNVVDLAVGVVIGAAFNKIVDAFVKGILMPPLGYITGGVDFTDKKIILQRAVIDAKGEVLSPENAIKYGEFIQSTIVFIITAFAVFLMIKMINALRKKDQEAAPVPDPTTQEILLAEIRDLLKQKP